MERPSIFRRAPASLWCATAAATFIRLDKDQVGVFEYAAVVNPGALQCTGASLLKTDYPDLYSKIGTMFGSVDSEHFTLPLLTDTNRYLRTAGGSLAGRYLSGKPEFVAHPTREQRSLGRRVVKTLDHSHTGSGSTGTESAAHTHQMSYPVAAGGSTYNESVAGTATSSLSTLGGNPQTGTESAAHSHAYSFTTSGISNVHQHSYSGTTSTVPASGGTESRPESLAVICGIRY